MNHYGANGSGRDGYVRIDNAGNTITNNPTARGPSDGTNPSQKFWTGTGDFSLGSSKRYITFSPRAHVPPSYVANGTGRDSYINEGNGGFLNCDYVPARQFESDLRKGQRSEKETTSEYLAMRNKRMKKFLSVDRK